MNRNFLKSALVIFYFILFISRKLKILIPIYSLYKFHLMNSKISLANNLLIFYFYTILKGIFSIIIIFYSRNFRKISLFTNFLFIINNILNNKFSCNIIMN